jgi:diguanylate cyclase (GGDEF)-like protein/PAS domain S-box-containing protein
MGAADHSLLGRHGLDTTQLHAVFEVSACGLVVQDESGRIVDANPAAEALLGLTLGQMQGLTSVDPRWRALDGEGRDLPGEQHPSMRTLATGQPVQGFEMGVCLPDGGRRWIIVSTRLLEREGSAPWVVSSFVDHTALRELRQQLAEQGERLRTTLEGTRTGTWAWNVQTGQTRFDERWAEIVGYRLAELEPVDIHTWARLAHPEDLERSNGALQRHFAGELAFYDVECRMRHRDGHWVWVRDRGRVASRSADGQPLWILGTHEDITDRKALEVELRDAALRDRLTGLPNRLALVNALQQALAAPGGEPFALLFLDCDRFKLVNDTLGHGAGDALLCSVATRLRGAPELGARALVARFGGDEFVVLVPGVADGAGAARVALPLLQRLAEPHRLQGRSVHSSASLGVRLAGGQAPDGADDDNGSADALLRDADIALYEAKRTRRGGWVLFDPGMRQRLARAAALETALRDALALAQFALVYQPIVDLETAQVVSAEALLRWRHPLLGAVSPAEFVPIAEESGAIVEIGAWVMHEACMQWAAWQREAPERAPRTISVNLSRTQLALGEALIDTVTRVLRDTGVPPAALQLEITEREVLQDTTGARAQMATLRAMGVKLAMDDFGTGASSLGCLREYPFHTIKIDKSFVTDLTRDPHVMAVAHATINVIEHLGMVSVAEGVEETGELAALQAMGCRLGQGWLFGRPVAGSAFMAAVQAA